MQSTPDVASKWDSYVRARFKERVIRMMTRACEKLYAAEPGATWVPELAPLSKGERAAVREIVEKRRQDDAQPAIRSAS